MDRRRASALVSPWSDDVSMLTDSAQLLFSLTNLSNGRLRNIDGHPAHAGGWTMWAAGCRNQFF